MAVTVNLAAPAHTNNQIKSNHNAVTALRLWTREGCGPGIGVMIKTVYAIAVAAIAAACFVAFPSLSPQVEASAPVLGAKADRADLRPLGTECGQKAWPYFDAACLRDARYPLVQPRDVRIVSADRKPVSIGR
jgi:hypothetical protein